MPKISKATRPFFGASKKGGQLFYEEDISFEWHNGMSWQVRQRSSDSLAQAILDKYSNKGLRRSDILEVSTASHNYETGQALSALNLTIKDEKSGQTYRLENWFQAAKVFEKDGVEFGPYPVLLRCEHPKRYVDINLDKKIQAQYNNDPLFNTIQNEIAAAHLKCFRIGNIDYPLLPRSAFYDYMYIKALTQDQNKELAYSLLDYRVFTDIMFNPGTGKKRKYNTQARSCAIYAAMVNRGIAFEDIEDFSIFVETVGYKQESQDTLFTL